MKKSVLVTLADENYIEYAKQLFSAAYWKGGWKGDYLLLAHNIPEEKLNWFRERNVFVYKCSNLDKSEENIGRFPTTVLSKINLLKTYFKKWDNVLFLDPDILIRYDINYLGQAKSFRAVKEIIPFDPIKEISFSKKDLDFINSMQKKYGDNVLTKFNTGVMAFSTKIIEEETYDDLLKMMSEYGRVFAFGEQPVFCIFFAGLLKYLPRYYNIFVPEKIIYYKMKERQIDGPILHVFDSNKPWNKESYFYSEWLDNYKKADQIKDFTKSNGVSKKFNLFKKVKYVGYFKLRDLYILLDRNIGKCGILLRKIFKIKKHE